MNIISRAEIEKAVKGDVLSGAILIKDYSKDKTTKGDDFLFGTLCSEIDIPFKLWTGADGLVNKLWSINYRGSVCNVDLHVDEWKGVKSYIMKKCILLENAPVAPFLPTRYNIQGYVDALDGRLKAILSPQGYSLVQKILYEDEELFTKFKEEFCAKSHHDSCKSGLLAHTFKVVNIMCILTQQYPFLTQFNPRECKVPQYRTDLFIIGALLHDIGKTKEMKMGVYQQNTAVTHRILGQEMMYAYKDLIVSVYDEKWYYDLIAVISQHHDKYGDPSTVIYSKVVAFADMLDTQMTSLGEAIDTSSKEDFAGKWIKFDGGMLFL